MSHASVNAVTGKSAELRARRRTQRRGTRQRILDSAARLLEEHSWAEISVELITTSAKLSRTAFYRFFDDRMDLLLALLETVGDELGQAGDLWYGRAVGSRSGLQVGLRRLTEIYVRHGRLLRAMAEAAVLDPEVRRRYETLGLHFVSASRARIEAEAQAGESDIEDAGELATCLTWTADRYLLVSFGRAPLGHPDRVAKTLYRVWARSIWGNDAASG